MGPVDLSEWIDGLHWVIAGGESGGGARPTQPGWIRGLRDQCIDAGVAFHFKQWGVWRGEGDGWRWGGGIIRADDEEACRAHPGRQDMERAAGWPVGMTNQVEMFGDRPSGKPAKLTLAEGGAPLRTAEKASLIDEYIHRFLLVTRHGVYLDLFAGPQRVDDTESWSVRRVLERRTAGNPSTPSLRGPATRIRRR